jgi:predicted DNA-binding transcriptional regulator AlpA
MSERVVFTEQEFCEAVHISRTKSWRLRKQGRLAHLRIGDRVGFLKRHIDEFLESCECAPTQRPRKSKDGVQRSTLRTD